MKKGQGAKNRSTYQEALKGRAAEGVVGFFITKQQYRATIALVVDAFKNLKKPLNSLQKKYLQKKEKELGILDNEIAHILQHAPKEHPNFLKDLAKAGAIRNAVYPAEVRMLEAYAHLRYLRPLEGSLEELPPPADVKSEELYRLVVDKDGNPNQATFSRMVKRYGLILQKNKGGRRKILG